MTNSHCALALGQRARTLSLKLVMPTCKKQTRERSPLLILPIRRYDRWTCKIVRPHGTYVDDWTERSKSDATTGRVLLLACRRYRGTHGFACFCGHVKFGFLLRWFHRPVRRWTRGRFVAQQRLLSYNPIGRYVKLGKYQNAFHSLPFEFTFHFVVLPVSSFSPQNLRWIRAISRTRQEYFLPAFPAAWNSS